MQERRNSSLQPRLNWLAEREPSHNDVEDASQIPERAWLTDFRTCLLASEDAIGTEQLLHIDLRVSRLLLLNRKLTFISHTHGKSTPIP